MTVGEKGSIRIKHRSMTAILIQVVVFSAIVGTLSPAVSAAHIDANIETSHPDFPELPSGEDGGFDWFNSTDDFAPKFVPGEVLVKFPRTISVRLEDDVLITDIESVDELNELFEVSEIKSIFQNVYRLTIPKDLDAFYVAREYELDLFVEYAEPNSIARTFLVPNDANYTQQWAHQVIESEDAWNATTGDPNVVIAIVDCGVDYNHPDLAANIWNNTDEIPDNGIDDDANGFVDDVRGWDFVENAMQVHPGDDGTEPDNDPMDFSGHGTHCAGIVAAVTNNEIGIAGVTWNSKIMAVRSGYATYVGGALTYDHIAAGIHYAADNGADIISLSFGGYYRSKVVYDAVKHAYDNGVLLVAAAGNEESRIKSYPAAYEEVVAVTATDQNDNPSYFTNFGNWVEVAAPGVDILSAVSPNASIGPYGFDYPYDYASGTSMAAPHVAGVAALILSRFPSMTLDQVRVQLRRTAVDKSDPGFDVYYGYGRINASGAVKQTPAAHDLLVLSWKLPFVSELGDTVAVNTTVLNFGDSIENRIDVRLLVNGTEEDSERINQLKIGESTTVSCSWTPTSNGTYNVTTYVEPVRGENVIENNAQFAYSWVRYGKAVKVPEDFPTIQEAIETTNLGIYGGDATIRVSNGTYNEYDLLIQNMLTSLTLAGENSRTTTILGDRDFAGVWANADNVTIKGLTIQGSSAGVQLWSGNCIVSSNNLTNNMYGISMNGYYNNTAKDNIVSGNNRYGICIVSSSGDTIINNTASSNRYGLFLYAANKTLVSDNNITNNFYGIQVTVSSDDVFTNNTLTGSNYGFGVQGDTLSHFLHDVDPTNTVDEKPIYYLVNQSNLVIEPPNFTNVGYLGLVNSTGVTVRNLTLSKSIQGVMFAYTKDSNIQNVSASSNVYGIQFFNSTNTFIINNTMTDDYYGVHTLMSTNNTITHNVLSNVNYGIYLSRSSSDNIGSNTVTNTYRGIYVYSSSDHTLEGNTVTESTYGIYLYGCESSLLTNTVTKSTYGIYLHGCESSLLTNNNMTENSYNFFVDGSSVAEYIHDIDTSNTANGKPIYYLINQAYLVIDPSTFPDIGYLGLVNSTNITVKNVTLPTNNGQGILFASVTHSAIRNVNVSNNYYGIYLRDSNKTSVSGNTLLSNGYGIRMINSHNSTIDGNVITEIDKEGIYLGSSSGNTISSNTVTEIDKEGIYLESSSGNTISSNTVSNCSRKGYYSGIILSNTGNNTVSGNIISHNSWGIELYHEGNDTVNDNNIAHNAYGIFLWYCDSGNTIRGNTIADNSEAFHIVVSSDNVIYHNNFINNTLQVYNSVSSNSWDNGAEGNYWSDYQGQDTDPQDGIGDTPYVIDESNQDNYPLMNLWSGLVYALNLHVMDWDLTDSIQGAYVYVDSDVKISDADGWANWTEISGAVYIKVKWYGVWVNGTFMVVVNSNKTIDIQCNIFDIVVTTVEGEQGAVLQHVNVTAYNATNSMIRTAITDSDGEVYLANVPNSTLTFTCYEGSSPQNIIANVTRTITTENQTETVICDQNGATVSQEWDIIVDNNLFSLSLVPLPAIGMLKYLRINTKGLKERAKKIRSKQGKKREEVKAKNDSST